MGIQRNRGAKPTMTSAQLYQLGCKLFGRADFATAMARALYVRDETVRRWLHDETPISGPAQAALEALAGIHPMQQPEPPRAKGADQPGAQKLSRALDELFKAAGSSARQD